MGFQSQEGQVGFATQSVKGTYVPPTTFAKVTTGGGLNANRELLIPDPEIGGNRDIPDAYLGPVAFSGEYELYPRAEVIATLLYGALGIKAYTVDTPEAGVNEHVITPDDVGSLPWLSVEEAVGDAFDSFQYTDAKVNSVHLEADANGYLTATAGLVALDGTGGNTKTATPTFDTTPLMVGSNVACTYKGSALPAKSFSIDINNNLEDDDFRLGSVFLGDITEKRRDLTAAFTIRPEDKDIWRAATFGSTAATTPIAGAADKGVLQVEITSYENVGATATPYTITVDVPVCTIRPFELTPSGDDVLEHDLEVQFLRPDPGVDIATVTILNEATAIA